MVMPDTLYWKSTWSCISEIEAAVYKPLQKGLQTSYRLFLLSNETYCFTVKSVYKDLHPDDPDGFELQAWLGRV